MRHSIFTMPEGLRFPKVLNENTVVGLRGYGASEELIAARIDSTVFWQCQLNQPCNLGAITDGICWLYGNDFISCIDARGREFKRIRLVLDEGERIGAITLHNESIIVSFYRKKPDRIRGLQPRILRLTSSGEEIWSQILPISKIAYSGVHYMGIDTGWESKEMPAWVPESWLPYGDDQLLISDDRLLASFQEMPRSGIGCRYVLSLKTGQFLWKSEASPISNALALPDGKFLLGIQGYGAFETHLYEGGDGEVLMWNSHGRDFITEEGKIMSVQMSNDSSVPQYLVELRSDGSIVTHSDRLPGYYTSKPVQLLDGNVFFWRGDHVWVWNQTEGIKSDTKIGLGKGSYASSHKLTESRFALNIRHGYGDRLNERIWAIFEY